MTLCRRPGTHETTPSTVWTPLAPARATRPLRTACLPAALAMVSHKHTLFSCLAHVSSIEILEELSKEINEAHQISCDGLEFCVGRIPALHPVFPGYALDEP